MLIEIIILRFIWLILSILLNKDFHFQMVRVGLSMYGYSPLSKINKYLSLKPALYLKVK